METHVGGRKHKEASKNTLKLGTNWEMNGNDSNITRLGNLDGNTRFTSPVEVELSFTTQQLSIIQLSKLVDSGWASFRI